MAETPKHYAIPARKHRAEEVIRKSRFITTLAHAPDPEAAHAFLETIRAEFPDATHHCWAFVAGPPGDTASVGMSDDGEPHGTAGRPMLTTLLHGGVGEIVAVCTRYFGGTKLGTGGLSRAYSGGVKLALEGLPSRVHIDRVTLNVTVDYDAVDALQRSFPELEVLVDEEDYGERVTYRVSVPEERASELEGTVADLTRGQGSVGPASK